MAEPFEGKIRISSKRTFFPLTELTSQDLLLAEVWPHAGKPPLQELMIEGLLSFGEKTTFQFGRLNILVGPNGAGKSNLIECLRILRNAPINIQENFGDGFEAWLYNGFSDKNAASATLETLIYVPGVPELLRHELRLGPPLRSQPRLEEFIEGTDSESFEIPYFTGSYRTFAELGGLGSNSRGSRMLEDDEYNSFQSILSQIRDKEHYPEITGLANLYSRFRVYSEWSSGIDSILRKASPTNYGDVHLSEPMNNLPAVLEGFQKTATHDAIRKILSELKDTYRDYITRIAYGQVGLHLIEDPWQTPIPATRLSDGTLHFLALATILLQPTPPPLICLDEPELGMHPDMIRMLAQMIIEASAKTQLIISTHSEHLLTALQDDFDVLFAFNGTSKGSVVQRLSKEEFHTWRSDHALGDLWSSGEIGGVRF